VYDELFTDDACRKHSQECHRVRFAISTTRALAASVRLIVDRRSFPRGPLTLPIPPRPRSGKCHSMYVLRPKGFRCIQPIPVFLQAFLVLVLLAVFLANPPAPCPLVRLEAIFNNPGPRVCRSQWVGSMLTKDKAETGAATGVKNESDAPAGVAEFETIEGRDEILETTSSQTINKGPRIVDRSIDFFHFITRDSLISLPIQTRDQRRETPATADTDSNRRPSPLSLHSVTRFRRSIHRAIINA
jgi:hypothetical protein